jgi:thymidylate kinase
MKKKILIEGSNYCGKTTITNMLKYHIPGTTALEFHDFYHQHILMQSDKIIQLKTKEDFENIDKQVLDKAEKYLNSRNKFVLEYLKRIKHDNTIIERSFLTQMVYRNLLFKIEEQGNLFEIEKLFEMENVKLILITASSDTILERMKIDNPKSILRAAEDIPYHLKEPKILVKKNELYNFYFNQLQHIKKYRIDTTDKTIEALSEIIKCVLES